VKLCVKVLNSLCRCILSSKTVLKFCMKWKVRFLQTLHFQDITWQQLRPAIPWWQLPDHQIFAAIDLVVNPDLEVRASRRVHNVALYRSAQPDLQIRIQHCINNLLCEITTLQHVAVKWSTEWVIQTPDLQKYILHWTEGNPKNLAELHDTQETVWRVLHEQLVYSYTVWWVKCVMLADLSAWEAFCQS